ncbi:MAG TPA: hypothetical protein PKM73_16615 [Verrucomicrobiota bacterium]|nr:hypothetical protein [Verrucomicrobiota bacterium]HNU49727.1 hypothetical protein [Verrucomicrobiota bacterium]
MRLLHIQSGHFVFRLTARDRVLLGEVLRHYPMASHEADPRSRRTPAAENTSSQTLLDEALAAGKAEGRRRLDALLQDRQRLAPRGTGAQLTLDRNDIEWFLQVLNDVRVGSWIRAGCPDPDQGREPRPTQATAPFFLTMELAAYYECVLLEALHGPSPARGDSR